MTSYSTPIPCYVYGEWQLDADIDPCDTEQLLQIAYPATLRGRWNGWAVPCVDRPTMARIVADNGDAFSWDGDSVVLADPNGDPAESQRVDPSPAGRYLLDIGWCWDTVDLPETLLAEAATAPTDAQRAVWETLRAEHDLYPFHAVEVDGAHTFRCDGYRLRIARDGSTSTLPA